MSLLDANDDYIEALRRWLWPKLHPILNPFGGYAVGTVGEDQHVVTLDVGEETFEHTLVDLGFVRNPMACYKHTEDGRLSEGSWVLLSSVDPLGRLKDDEQLHVTLFQSDHGIDVYAHSEYDWRRRPIDHVEEEYFSPTDGVEHMNRLLVEHTDLL